MSSEKCISYKTRRISVKKKIGLKSMFLLQTEECLFIMLFRDETQCLYWVIHIHKKKIEDIAKII